MFIKKITGVKNFGKFHRGGVSGGEYAKYTLFYGGNGRGKTTLCALLRSLQRNDPVFIMERQTLGEPGSPEAQLLLDSGPIKFSGGAWSAAGPDIHIFDSHFIAENVHGGEQIETDHRRNAYRVIVGTQGVALASRIDELDAQATTKQTEINGDKKALQQHLPKGMTLEKFLALEPDAMIESKILAAKASLKAADNSTEINARKKIELVAIPNTPEDFESTLGKTLSDVSSAASARVQAHLAKHNFHETGEQWLAQGIKHIAEGACPFCGNILDGNELIEAYKGYFSEAYAAFKNTLTALRTSTEAALSEAAGLRTAQAFKAIDSEVAFWRGFAAVHFDLPAAVQQIGPRLAALATAALKRIDDKIAAPLEPPSPCPAFDAAFKNWSDTVGALVACNALIPSVNTIIQTVKDGNAMKDKASAEAEVNRLTAIETRNSDPVLSLAKTYESLSRTKDTIVAEKNAKKAELDIYDAKILGAYEAVINKFLRLFGASFRLTKSAKNYIGKTPQSVYHIQFDKSTVDVTAKGDDGKPSFRTTMGAGDKSTLALAFFLAQIERDSDITNKVVVFDDPYTSLDEFRREITAKSIVHVGENASQVIVFSHDKYFLDAVRRKLPKAQCQTLQISSTALNAVIESWDIEREVKEGYLQDHMTLFEFSQGANADAKSMRTLMRPVLQKYICYRFPNKIPEGKGLGEILAIIRDDPGHPLQSVYQEIDDINEYTAPFHHDPNAPFNPDEVKTYVQRTLDVVGGC